MGTCFFIVDEIGRNVLDVDTLGRWVCDEKELTEARLVECLKRVPNDFDTAEIKERFLRDVGFFLQEISEGRACYVMSENEEHRPWNAKIEICGMICEVHPLQTIEGWSLWNRYDWGDTRWKLLPCIPVVPP